MKLDLTTEQAAVTVAGGTLVVTIVLAVITGYYARQTTRLVHLAQEQLESSLGAFLWFGFEVRGQLIVLVLRNGGSRVARAIRFETDFEPDEPTRAALNWPRLQAFLGETIQALPPVKAIYRDFATSRGIEQWRRSQTDCQLAVPVTLRYHNGFRQQIDNQVLAPEDALVSQVLAPHPNFEMDPELRVTRALERISEPAPNGGSIFSQLARIADQLGRRSGQSP